MVRILSLPNKDVGIILLRRWRGLNAFHLEILPQGHWGGWLGSSPVLGYPREELFHLLHDHFGLVDKGLAKRPVKWHPSAGNLSIEGG